MKTNVLLLAGLGTLAILAGCSKSEAPAASAPATADANAPVTVDLTAGDSMKYNLTTIEAKPGQEVHVTLTNIGTMPKAAMAHNFILLQKGTDPKAFSDAAVSAAATDYFPASMADKVIAHTKLLGPKQSDEITFKAPTEPGEYPFLCSFPAHYLAGMHGTLTVK
ncbi:MAG TPA: azurin [Candidatus Didemnitutus sp.]|nr:azurin [Candidatus Didemnitutus sp.]